MFNDLGRLVNEYHDAYIRSQDEANRIKAKGEFEKAELMFLRRDMFDYLEELASATNDAINGIEL